MAFLRTSWCSAKNAEMRCTRNALGNVRCSLCLSSIDTEPWSRFTGRRCAAQLTCVWCRAKWPSGAKRGTCASPTSEGYVNLGSAVGISGQRDTSSCAPMTFILLLLLIDDATSVRPSELAIRRKQEQDKSCLRGKTAAVSPLSRLDSLSAITHFSNFEYNFAHNVISNSVTG